MNEGLLNTMKCCVLGAVLLLVMLGATFGVADFLYQSEWREEQWRNEQQQAEEYSAAVLRQKEADRFERIFKEGATKVEVAALIAEHFGKNFPSPRIERNLTEKTLLWTPGSSQWFVVSESVLARYNPRLTETSIATVVSRFFLRTGGAVLITVAVASISCAVYWLMELVSTPLFSLNSFPHRLTTVYQKRLIRRDTVLLGGATVYLLVTMLLATLSLSHRSNISKTASLLGVVLRMSATYNEEYTNDGNTKISTPHFLYLTVLQLLLFSSSSLFLFAFLRLHKTWTNSQYVVIQPLEYRNLLEKEQSPRKNELSYFKKYD